MFLAYLSSAILKIVSAILRGETGKTNVLFSKSMTRLSRAPRLIMICAGVGLPLCDPELFDIVYLVGCRVCWLLVSRVVCLKLLRLAVEILPPVEARPFERNAAPGLVARFDWQRTAPMPCQDRFRLDSQQ